MDQVGIAVFGVVAVFLSQDKRQHVARWACVFGLAAQPFWFYATFTAQQWGMFALCFLYTLAWARGARTYWWPSIRRWAWQRLDRRTPGRCVDCGARLTPDERTYYGNACESCETNLWRMEP